MSMAESSPFDDLAPLLTMLVGYLPLFIAWLVGSVLCILRWRRHPMVSLLALIAFVLFALEAFIGRCLWFWLWQRYHDSGWSNTQFSSALSVLVLARSGVTAVGWILILVALFGWRHTRKSSSSGDVRPVADSAPSTAIQASCREARS